MRRRTKSVADQHQDWLSQVDSEGPFLAVPVLKDIWPQGVERLGDADDRMVTFKQAYVQWQRVFDVYSDSAKSEEARGDYTAVTRAWIDLALDDLAGWQDLRLPADDTRLTDLGITSPGGEITVRPSGALEGRDGDLAALLLVSTPTTDLRATGLDGWAATEIDRMAMLLRKARVEVGIVTDGQWWAVVWAKDGKPTGSGVVNAVTWAEEPLLRDAFLTLVDQRRFRGKDAELRLARLFERSELEAEVITEELGKQVRKSVELLVQAFSEARVDAAERGDADPLTDKPDDIYQAAVTIMMRVVFLLFAEEREMLPTEQLYWDSYAIRDLLDDLLQQATDGEEHLDESYDAWHRLLAVSQALYAGVDYDEMRMPAYGGSLLDPARFPWVSAVGTNGLQLKVSDRVMLHVFDSVQTVVVKNERRRISFRDIDVEQIGYIYEGLLGYTCHTVEGDVVLGLVGKDGAEPEITLATLQQMYDDSTSSKDFASALVAWVKEDQPAAVGKSVSAIAKFVDKDIDKPQEAELTRLLTPVAGHDPELLAQLVSWGNLIRRDLRDIPYVVPTGGLIVSETPSRKNAGAHYTPRSLAEEVVKYALEPLVYEPGPLQINDENAWTLKSSTAILDLNVADIAAGSGAFLVAAARFLAARVTEAWTDEGMLSGEERASPKLANDRAIREVIARCLYGADINPMAVEMCKLSLWLVSMDKSKPFSFVDDKIFCGNSLLGITSLDQLRALHIYPDASRPVDLLHDLVDVEGSLAEATRIRKELNSPVDEHNPMRSTHGKLALLDQLREVTANLRWIADGIVATGLPLGGKRGAKLDNAYKVMTWELTKSLVSGRSESYSGRVEAQDDPGPIPKAMIEDERWRPLHWVLEVPDIFLGHRGFDAVVGNPPFMYGREISAAYGETFREWLVNVDADARSGVADLCAYFFLRAYSITRRRGQIGMLATNTIAQGDTRYVSLDALARNASIRRAVRSRPWPTHSVNLEIALIWISLQPTAPDLPRWVNGEYVPSISSLLEPSGRIFGNPRRLRENAGKSFMGANLNGTGFLMPPEIARRMIFDDAANQDVLGPYLTGEDLNDSPSLEASRWAVNFYDWDEDVIARYEQPYEWILRELRPHRLTLVKKPRLQSQWWKYEARAVALFESLRGQRTVTAISLVSKHLVPSMVTSDQIFSHRIGVFLLVSPADLATLNSELHVAWARNYGSTLETRLNYSLTDVFQTFPRPTSTDRLGAAGEMLETTRRELMAQRHLGLTRLYNLVHDRGVTRDAGVSSLREIHVEIDEATMAAYGWDDVPLKHGFHNYRQMERWTVSGGARVEILDRLLELNHQRAREEGQDIPEQRELV